jgi:aminoglycoside phosphotransferase (APT) family kinase protein
LAERGRYLDAGVAARQFASGLANLNYVVSLDGVPVVFRRPPDGPTGEGSNDMAREFAVLSKLADHFPLAPHALAFCDEPEVIGVPFQLLEYRPGRAVGATVPDDVAARGGADVGHLLTVQLVRTMAALHALDPERVGLGELGRPEGFLGRQVEGWARRCRAAFGADEPAAVGPILDALRATLPRTSAVALLHGDLKFDNVLVDVGVDTLAPVAVVDWDMATRGDPLFDLAVLLSYWVEAADPPEIHALGQVPSLEPGFPGRDEVVRLYGAAAGRPELRTAHDLAFHLTLARFRLAVAWQQMFVKYERGALVEARYASFDSLARSILEWTAATLPRR